MRRDRFAGLTVVALTVVALVSIASVFPARALPPPDAAAGVKWFLPQTEILIVGDMSADAGLECIGMSSLGMKGLYRLGTGVLLQALPSPFDDFDTTYTLRDVDNDGRAEIFCLDRDDQISAATLGLLDYGGSLTRMWPDMALGRGATLADVVNLSAVIPQAVVITADFEMVIVDAADGSVVYDTANDPEIPTGVRVDSALVDDFDLDGYDDILLSMWTTSEVKLVFLIGAASNPSAVDGLTGPGLVKLQQSWPNPVNGSSTIRFELERQGNVRLRIFDAGGRLVRTIMNDQMPAGSHTRVWDGRDGNGRDAASGIYFYELDFEGQRLANKLVQVR